MARNLARRWASSSSAPSACRPTISSVSTCLSDAIAAVEARGFLFAAPLAIQLRKPLIPLRKPGKLPSATHKESYNLEYGTDALEIHTDAMGHKARILIVDDVLATGGTARAAVDLVRKVGADVIGVAFLIELDFLAGRAKLGGEPVYSVLRY